MKKKMIVVVNPVSGVGKQRKMEQVLEENLNRDLFDYTVRYTERIHHGTEIAQEAVEKGYDCVVAVGGDGSVNDVVQGIKDSGVTMGIIPCGSGNGLARSLKIPLTPARAVQLLNGQHEQYIDSIVINDNLLSVNASGVGFDAYIARLMKAAKTRGFNAYVNLFLREYTSYKGNDYTITVDGRTLVRNAWFIAVANSQQYGYNLAIAPKAKLDDGLIDISIIEKIPIDHIAITAPLAFMKHIDLSQHVETIKAKDILIEGNVDKWVNIDGEGINVGKTVHFVNHPHSVKIYGR